MHNEYLLKIARSSISIFIFHSRLGETAFRKFRSYDFWYLVNAAASASKDVSVNKNKLNLRQYEGKCRNIVEISKQSFCYLLKRVINIALIYP